MEIKDTIIEWGYSDAGDIIFRPWDELKELMLSNALHYPEPTIVINPELYQQLSSIEGNTRTQLRLIGFDFRPEVDEQGITHSVSFVKKRK
jgi:hypothetical protein